MLGIINKHFFKFFTGPNEKDQHDPDTKEFYEMHQIHIQSHSHLRQLSQSPPRLINIHSATNSSNQSSPPLSQSNTQMQSQHTSSQPTHTLTQLQQHHQHHQHHPQQQHQQQQHSPHLMHSKIQKGPPSSMQQSSATSIHHSSHINQNGVNNSVSYNGHHQTQNGETRPSVIESNQPIIIGCT